MEYATFLSEYLAEQGDEVHFYTWRENPLLQPLAEAEATLHFLGSKADRADAGGPLRRLIGLERAVRKFEQGAVTVGADVVHNLYLDYGELSQYLSGWMSRSPVPGRFATLFWPHFVHTGAANGSLGRRAYRRLVLKAVGRMLSQGSLATLFVHTEGHREQLIEALGPGRAVDRINVVPGPPVELDETASRAEAREHLGLPQDSPIVLFFGGLQKDKGIDLLLRSVPLLDDDLVTVLAGEPVDISSSDVERTRGSMTNPERLVERFGRVSDGEVSKYMAAADVVVLPYRRSHVGTSGVLQRAAAAGRPVVATDVGQIGPLVRDNGLGLVIEPGSSQALADGLRRLLTKSDSWRRQVEASTMEYASRNDWRSFGREVRAAYVAAF